MALQMASARPDDASVAVVKHRGARPECLTESVHHKVGLHVTLLSDGRGSGHLSCVQDMPGITDINTHLP